jgi:hypothetical protein
MVPLSVTQNQEIIVQYELACVPDCFHVEEAIHLGEKKARMSTPRPQTPPFDNTCSDYMIIRAWKLG